MDQYKEGKLQNLCPSKTAPITGMNGQDGAYLAQFLRYKVH